MSRTWNRLAEALGIETEAGTDWQKINRQKNMQRYGTQDRRNKQGPMSYFNVHGTGSAQRQTTMAGKPANMTPAAGGLKIPQGTDKPGQGNPMFDPPRPTPMVRRDKGPGGTWADMLNAVEDDGSTEESKFSTLSHKLDKNPKVKDPDALAAAIGRKKYGAKKMGAKAAAGRKH